MNTYPHDPLGLPWAGHEVADAAPLRLFELHRFDADSVAAGNTARFVRRTSRGLRGGYARPAPLPARFSVHL